MNKLTQLIKIKLEDYAEKRKLTKQQALLESLELALAFERGVFNKTEFKVMLRELAPVKLNKAQIYHLKNKAKFNERRSRNRRIKHQRKVV